MTVGTIAWIAGRYTTDPESPYQDLRASSRRMYDDALSAVLELAGDRRMADMDGPAITRLYRAWGRADDTGQLLHPRRAYGCIQLLRVILSYGVTLRDADCRALREVLSAMVFEVPRKRTQRMTAAHVRAIREHAYRAGRPSIALAVTLQFELALRQKDVIGEWEAGEWSGGLTWEDVTDWVLRKPTSKSNGRMVVEHNLRDFPELMIEIQRVPSFWREGPMVICERTKRPYGARSFRAAFRRIATAAKVPADVWNMDTRAGAISEAYEAGAAPADVMKIATHTQLSTSMRYNRGALEQSGRVAELRAKRRTA